MVKTKTMKLLLKRTKRTNDYTLGELFINGKFFCYTCEDTDRGIINTMPLATIQKVKVKDKTCIPATAEGHPYKITLDVVSPKYSNFTRYKWAKFCNGKIPRFVDVPGYSGVLIHVGNKANDTSGCLLVGFSKLKDGVGQSTACFTKLYEILLTDKNNIELEIV